jgi:membrane-associated phospholipid phosphatase
MMAAWAVELVQLHDAPQVAIATVAAVMAALATWARLATRSLFAAIVRQQMTRAGGAPLVLGAVFALTVLVAVTEERLEPEADQPDEVVWQLDRLVRHTAHRFAQWPGVHRVTAEFSQSTGVGIAVLLLGTAGHLLGRRCHREVAVVLGGTLGAVLLAMAAKSLVGLPRPRLLEALGSSPPGDGFPSVHAMVAAAACGLCAWAVGRRLDRRRRMRLWALVAIVTGTVGVTRIVVDEHWLSDVVAGLSMGSLWACLVLMVVVRRPGSVAVGIPQPRHSGALAHATLGGVGATIPLHGTPRARRPARRGRLSGSAVWDSTGLAATVGHVRLSALFLVYALLHVVIRLLAPGAVEHDESEQVLQAQSLAIGYGKHPPLYTWLQYGVFRVLGVGVLGLAVLKHACLLGVYAGTYQAARRVQGDAGLATLTVLSLWLVPAVVWEAPRDLTHSVLAAALVPPTVQLLVGLVDRPVAWRYAALGAIVGLGILAKYNFALFITVFLAAALSVPSLRVALADRRIALSVGVAAIILGPHLAWLATDAASPSLTARLRLGEWADDGTIGLTRPLLDVVVDIAAFLGPLVIVVYLVAGVRWGAPDPDPLRRASRQLLERYLVGLIAVLMLSAPLAGFAGFKARWLLPLLIVAPLTLFVRVAAAGIQPRPARRLVWLCAAAGILALCLRLGDVWTGPRLGHPSRLHLPITELAGQIRETGFRQGTLIVEDPFLGGSLRLHFPDSRILTPYLAALDVAPPSARGQCLVVWRPRRDPSPPASLLAFASARLGRPPSSIDVVRLEVPLRHFSGGAYRVHVLAMPPGPPPCERAIEEPYTAPRAGLAPAPSTSR